MALPAALPFEQASKVDQAATSSSPSWTSIAAQRWNAMALDEFIYNYRKKLGSNDTKPWERVMEASVRSKKTLLEVAKRPAKLKSDLIDVDFVRGSTFPKEKSTFPWTFISGASFVRVVLLPLRSNWWIEQTSEAVYRLLSILYFLQLTSLALWAFVPSHSPLDEWISASDILTPVILMLIVSEILTQADRHDQASTSSQSFKQHSPDKSPRDTEGGYDVSLFDIDDLASLSDRSCRSSSPSDLGSTGSSKRSSQRVTFSTKTKVKRRTKQRSSRSPDFEIFDHHLTHSELDIPPTSDIALLQSESSGFTPNALLVPITSKRHPSKGDETTDSGLHLTVPKTQVRSRKKNQDRGADDERDEEMEESDVSDMELTPVAKEVVEEVSTSDKEASDDDQGTETNQITNRINNISSNSSTQNSNTKFDTDEDNISVGDETEESPGIFLQEPQSSQSMQSERVVYPIGSDQLVGCNLWEKGQLHKADLSVYEITNCIVRQVEARPSIGSLRWVLVFVPFIFAVLPLCHGLFRTFLSHGSHPVQQAVETVEADFAGGFVEEWLRNMGNECKDWSVVLIKTNGFLQRFLWGFWFFLLLAVSSETYQQRYLIAKYFGFLTSSRRAKRASLPHFRLSKVRNVKSWLCIRSCLKKYGPRKSVDVVVSFSCISCLVCVIFTCFMVVRAEENFTSSIYVWEAMCWLLAVGIFLLKFMMLGSKTNQKFHNSSILTTEQLNLYLRMEQKPHKKEELMLVNNVLKLAGDLIKEIEHPCRISGFPANPFLYNVSRLLILSAFSTLISEICGFKLKLYKLKM
ncbi:hypothetical protein RvY_14258 [Ramazzottius varieornatus]|uniref:PHTF1/2 N-terminal domain-containing protein n=1 Tax=Ramazzottius varieornatus TaxID=947166 RepID=A0A1D1VQQ7_RAMVA|nr:hypothetical protein RvY_14258 [Ramazzottius varieornatus]